MNIIHMNVRGLQPKRYEMRGMLVERDIQIAIITESHSKDVQDVTIVGYIQLSLTSPDLFGGKRLNS